MSKKILFLIISLVIIQNLLAFEINSSTYKTEIVISDGGGNSVSQNYQTEITFGIASEDMNSSSYKQSIGFMLISCTANTCASLGYTCNSWSDGCGGTIHCGTCSSGYTCNNGACINPNGAPGGQKSSSTTNKNGNINLPETKPTTNPVIQISPEKKYILQNESLKIKINLENLSNKTLKEVLLKYWIVDEKNNTIIEKSEIRIIEEEKTFDVEILLPPELQSGKYQIYGEIIYGENKTAIAQNSFEVVTCTIESAAKKLLEFPYTFIPPAVLILIIIFISMIKCLIDKIKNHKKKKNHKKD